MPANAGCRSFPRRPTPGPPWPERKLHWLTKRCLARCANACSSAHVRELEAHLADCDRDIARDVHSNVRAQRLARVRGADGPTASALAATVIDPQQYRCGRQFAA
jgi:hypothetical protein